MRMKPTLTTADVATIVTAARAEADANGWAVSIAVVDEAGLVWRLDRGEGASSMTVDVARGKAAMAAATGRPSKIMEDTVRARPAITTLSGWTMMQGGVPIIVEGECIGGVGVSGVASEDDERIAFAGVKALG